MGQCPNCGWRAEDSVCPLCGVRPRRGPGRECSRCAARRARERRGKAQGERSGSPEAEMPPPLEIVPRLNPERTDLVATEEDGWGEGQRE